jgi:hypothetical protein
MIIRKDMNSRAIIAKIANDSLFDIELKNS